MDQKITIKGRKLYRGAEVVGEITGWRQMTAKWGATGPGYGFKLINGRECEPCYAYFDETVRAAKLEAAMLPTLPTDDQWLAALGPCGR
jgi:hypothetical protein